MFFPTMMMVEVDRVHQQHWIFRYALQGNYFAPVKDKLLEGIVVLDSGCGPATWTFEMGETYPRSTFHGIDASCVFPEDIKPANVEFIISNIAKDVPFEDNYFDYIHQRLLILGLTSEDWTKTLDNLFRVLKPGGYIELAEPDVQDLTKAGPAMHKLQSILLKMSTDRGLPPDIAQELKDRLAKAGFVDIEEKITNIPLNHSGKVGKLLWDDYNHVYNNMRGILARINPEWENAEAYASHLQVCAAEAKKSKTCLKWHSIHCRKPEETTP
ncbi:S-adenosyl-L-methionine-dependent methyltransferase [Helicostylum pulchrum]|nr:S-adenosyl-L-methionine-dependent methyltransferase [Helicostylum pulchrum]